MEINEEIDQVILYTILRVGVEALPMDYEFLTRYNLKNIYFQAIDIRLSGLSLIEINRRLHNHVNKLILQTSFPILHDIYNHKGKRGIFNMLSNNNLYYTTIKLIFKTYGNSTKLHRKNKKTL